MKNYTQEESEAMHHMLKRLNVVIKGGYYCTHSSKKDTEFQNTSKKLEILLKDLRI